MKVRDGFVSNSSSSSFIIHRDRCTPQQWANSILLANNPRKLMKRYGLTDGDNYYYCIPEQLQMWCVTVEDDAISGYTTMDNFSFIEVLSALNIPYEGREE